MLILCFFICESSSSSLKAYASYGEPIPGSAGGPSPCDPSLAQGLSLKLAGNITSASRSPYGDGTSGDAINTNNNNNNNNASQAPSLKLRLYDSITSRTMDRVTYAIRITNNNINTTVLEGLFVSSPGSLVMNFRPWEAGHINQTLVDPSLQTGPVFYSDARGVFTVKNSLLLEKDTKYSVLVGILAMDHGALCPDANVPFGEYSWTTTSEGKLVTVPEFPSPSTVFGILTIGIIVPFTIMIWKQRRKT